MSDINLNDDLQELKRMASVLRKFENLERVLTNAAQAQQLVHEATNERNALETEIAQLKVDRDEIANNNAKQLQLGADEAKRITDEAEATAKALTETAEMEANRVREAADNDAQSAQTTLQQAKRDLATTEQQVGVLRAELESLTGNIAKAREEAQRILTQ